jgi:hypothetical protein
MSPQQTKGPINHRDQAILQAYGVLSALHGIDTQQPLDAEKPVLINDILAFVKGRVTPETVRVEVALGSNLTLRRQYRQLLQNKKLAHIARPRAAHSGDMLEKRIGEHGVVLKLKQSKGHEEQYYLILELPESIAATHDQPLVLHANTDTQTERAVFPPAQDGRSQIILRSDELLFSLLHDHDVEIDIH